MRVLVRVAVGEPAVTAVASVLVRVGVRVIVGVPVRVRVMVGVKVMVTVDEGISVGKPDGTAVVGMGLNVLVATGEDVGGGVAPAPLPA